jgi:hypothetical protein
MFSSDVSNLACGGEQQYFDDIQLIPISVMEEAFIGSLTNRPVT